MQHCNGFASKFTISQVSKLFIYILYLLCHNYPFFNCNSFDECLLLLSLVKSCSRQLIYGVALLKQTANSSLRYRRMPVTLYNDSPKSSDEARTWLLQRDTLVSDALNRFSYSACEKIKKKARECILEIYARETSPRVIRP